MNVFTTGYSRSHHLLDNGCISLTDSTYHIAKSLLEGISKFLFALVGKDSRISQRTSLFEEVVGRHNDVISRLCFGYARTRAEYDDLRQDALINIWQSLKSYRGDASLRTWIHRVTLNTCVSTLRKREKEITAVELDQLYDVIDQPDEEKEMLAELHRCIETLSPTDKAVILLWLEGMSYEEIASMTGLGRNTLATRLKRAKDKIANIHLKNSK